ncbi:hypothetical protein PENNAL_c0876G02464, partial [Penicillium nalgiovense]
PLFRAGQVGKRLALTAQDHTFICKIFILGKTKYTVDVVDLVAHGETLERQVLDASPDVSDR